MLILHTFLALLAGFATMAAILALATLVVGRFLHQAPSQTVPARRSYLGINLWINLAYSLAAALAGGYVTATLSRENPLIHSLALALIVLLLAAFSAVQSHIDSRPSTVNYPVWFTLLLVALTPCAVVVGGLLRLKILGVL